MLAPLLTALIVLGYAGSLWWLLRRESTATLCALATVCALSLALRLTYVREYPPGFNEDEPKVLHCAAQLLAQGQLLGDCIAIPVLLHALFEAQLVPIVGPNRWAIRGYSMVTSILATPAAFALARSVGWRILPSLASGAFIAVLPWAMFYSRVFDGGELVFHQVLLLAALARLMLGIGAWVELGIGAFALTLLLYDYFCGRAMAPMPLVAAVLARGWRARIMCVAIVALAFGAFWPHQRLAAHSWGLSGEGVHEGFATKPLETLVRKGGEAVAALVYPVARDEWRTIRSAAMHPPLALALALLGSVAAGWRVALFLWAAYLGGAAPAVISWGEAPSTHRMLMAFAPIAIAAGGAFNLIPWRWPRRVAVVACVAVVAVQAVRLFFSPAFWPLESAGTFDANRTALVEALPAPPHERLVAMEQLGYYGAPLTLVDSSTELLRVDNFLPDNDGTLYAFSQHAAALRPFYDHLFGPERVRVFGGAFLVKLEPADWSWLRTHGWTYEVVCDGIPRSAQVPTLFHMNVTFKDLACSVSAQHRWAARWRGPQAALRLRFTGRLTVEVNGETLVQTDGYQAYTDFAVTPGARVRVALTSPVISPDVHLYEMLPSGERVPAWERWSPQPWDEAVFAPAVEPVAEIVEGFASIVSFQATHLRYPDYRGATQSWWLYGNDPAAEIAWRTAPVPRRAVTAVAVTASVGDAVSEAHLWVSGEYALTFETGQQMPGKIWHRGGYQATFVGKQIVDGYSGVFLLRVPAEAVQPDQPLQLMVRLRKAENGAWFMIKGYPDTAAHEALTPASVDELLHGPERSEKKSEN